MSAPDAGLGTPKIGPPSPGKGPGGNPSTSYVTLLSWAKSKESNDADSILRSFDIQRKIMESDKGNSFKKVSTTFRSKLKNHNDLGTGSFLAVARPGSTKLGWICGMGMFSAGLLASSEYDCRDIGLISDRTEHSEAAPGMYEKEIWKYHKVSKVGSSVIEIDTFYAKAGNRYKFFDDADRDTKSMEYIPGFLIIPQELVAWFLENEPTAFELFKKITSLYKNAAEPDELELAIDWCLVSCCANATEFRQSPTAILFSPRETACAAWFKGRVETLIGRRHVATPAQPLTTPQAIPAPGSNTTQTVTPSPKKLFLELSKTAMATITVLSNKRKLEHVGAAWAKMVAAVDVSECATVLEAEVEKMRTQLKVMDGKTPDLDYEQIVTDLKNLNLAPGGRGFTFDKYGEGLSVINCRQLTHAEVSSRDQKRAAANLTAEKGNLTYRDSLNLLRRDPSDPPASFTQLVKCVTAYGVLVAVVFTEDCPHFQELWALRELIVEQDQYERDYFTPHVCRLIIFDILRDANQYFRHTYQDDVLQQTRIPFPSSNLKDIGNCISHLTAPPTPLTFPQKWRSQDHDSSKDGGALNGGGGNFGANRRGGDQDKNAFGAFGAGGGTPADRHMHADFKTLLAPLRDIDPYANIGSLCAAAGKRFNNLPYMNSAGSARNMCYQHLFGDCRRQRCPRYHVSNEELRENPEFVQAICEALQPGVNKIVAEGKRPRKRPWDQK